MTQLDLLSSPCDDTLVARVAQVFLQRPGQWIDMHTLESVGGCGGWRTRVSDCRRQIGMRIENRVRRQGGYTVSEYRYVPGARA